MTIDQTALTPSTAPTSGKPLTAKELLAHPAYPTNDWSDRIPPTSSGYAQINARSKRSGGPFRIHYELHGTGPTKIIWIMGLGAYRTAWKRQSKYFGHERKDKYTCLVYDNRGVGLSDKPTARYSTREMAADAVEVLNHVGWLDPTTTQSILDNFYSTTNTTTSTAITSTAITSTAITSTQTSTSPPINICGVSMGGMIAQELALLLPAHTPIQSLLLISTAPRLVRTILFLENLRQRINMFVPRALDVQLDEIAHRLFSSSFLESPDRENPNDPHLNFPTNRDRFAASELAKRQDKTGFTRTGFVLQAIAAGWHHKSRTQLRGIVERVEGRRICVMHGTGDQMLTYRHFELFREDMGEESGVEYMSWEGKGHVLMWEEEEAFNRKVEDFIGRAERLGS